MEWDLTYKLVGGLVGGYIVWHIVGYPYWNVWASKKSGEAQLQEALNTQRIQLAEAKARKEAATLNKESAIIEAEAVSEQIKRIGVNLSKHDLYLKWQWINMMKEQPEGSTIYVPTEANLPILEAGKRPVIKKRKVNTEEEEEEVYEPEEEE